MSEKVLPSDLTNDQKELALRILRYLVDHPDARDTVEGITEWWLLEQRIQESKSEVLNVVKELVESGLVVEQVSEDQRRLFSINPDQIPGIVASLNGKQM